MEYYSSVVRNELEMHIATLMNLKGIMLSEKCQFHTVYFHFCDVLKRTRL